MDNKYERSFAELTLVNLNDVIRDVNEIIKQLVPNKGITIETDLSEDLMLIKSDKSQLEQVLLNLIINARDAMPDGGLIVIETSNAKLPDGIEPPNYSHLHPDITKELLEAARKRRECVLLSVCDTGCGMTEEIMARMYEPFFTTREGNTGLGLSVVRGLVNCLGGDITVSSEIEAGTKFEVYLPRL
jgi:two-component system, cell cycle sensor histidine kinase and response regulator CckA